MTAAPVIACSLSTEEALGDSGAEALTVARQLAGSSNEAVTWVVVGAPHRDLGEVAARHGAARVEVLSGGGDAPAEDGVVTALSNALRSRAGRTVVFAQTLAARTIAPRVAARLGGASLMNVVAAKVNPAGGLTAIVRAFGGDTLGTYDFSGDGPHILAILPRAVAVEPVTGGPASAPVTERAVPELRQPGRVRVVKRPEHTGARLEGATIVVAGGRGLGDPSRYPLIESLAEALGGMPAASRPLVDDGWVDGSLQVGLTGTVVQPELYVAVGISGASQHMAGCSGAKVIVAINSDEDAPIFRYARFGVVADAATFLPALITAVKGT